ncbi:MAG: DUF4249 domain-containing protein [Prevotellaceae bacterium]|jgi:hypothetical protein|nr:DUF4249 domain-containing protein [Prevotellaceae bacterium]
MKKKLCHYSSYMLATALAILACGCEREIKFNGEELKPKLVLHCFPESGAPVRLTLKAGKFFLSQTGSTREPVAGADVRLWKNGEFAERLRYVSNYENSYYESSFRPQPGDEITIRASASGFDPIECTTVMPEPPAALSAEHSGTWKNGIVCHIRDISTRAEYYRIGAFVEIDDMEFDIPIDSDDMVFGMNESELFESARNIYFVFSDELFNGKDYSLKFRLNDLMDDHKRCKVVLRHISKDYYLYVRTVAAESDEVFSEPVQIYSNVNGGIGILAASTSAVAEVTFGKIR